MSHLLTTGIFNQRAAVGFDADYQEILDYATTQGYTLPSSGQQTKQNTLVVALKSAGVWAKLDVLKIYATDGNQDYACINWVNPGTFNATRVNSPTYTTNAGFTGGTGTRLDTNFTPSTQAVQMANDNASYGGWFGLNINSVSGLEIVSGTLSPDRNFIRVTSSGTAQGEIHGASATRTFSNPVVSSSGFIHIDKSSSTTGNFNKNGVSQTAFTPQVSIGLSADSFTELALATNASPSLQQIWMSFYGASLQTEASNFYTALNTYFTSL